MTLFSDSAEVIFPGMPAKIGKAQYDQVRQGFDSGFKEALKCCAGTVWASGRSWTYT